MNVLMDASALRRENLTGVGIYVQQILKALSARQEVRVTAGLPLRKWRGKKLVAAHWGGKQTAYSPWLFGAADLFHAPDSLIAAPRGRPLVSTIHDMFPFQEGFSEPKFLQDKRQKFAKFARRSWAAIIAPSAYVAREVARYYPELESKTFVVAHGVDHIPKPETIPGRAIAEKYFLFVGTMEIRKNVIGVVKAFERLKGFEEYRLVLAGGSGFGADKVKAAIESSPARSRIVQIGHVAMGAGLYGLFHHAESLVLPSFAEGFCIPLLEAMRADCPVITARATATEEVAGPAGVLVDPHDPVEIAEAMARLASQPDLRKKLIELGRLRQADFTWARAAAETEKVYAKVLG